LHAPTLAIYLSGILGSLWRSVNQSVGYGQLQRKVRTAAFAAPSAIFGSSALGRQSRRPPKPRGLDPVVSARLPRDVVAAINAWADQNEVESRQEAIKRLIEVGLSVRSRSK